MAAAALAKSTTFVYESLPPLTLGSYSSDDGAVVSPSSTVDCSSATAYNVFRNVIGAEVNPTCDAAALRVTSDDFFSLDAAGSPVLSTPEWTTTVRAGLAAAPEPATASERVWFRGSRRFRSPMLQLHKEILDFSEFISPTAEEEAARRAAVQAVSDVVKHIWPQCRVEVFGSFRTGLYLPTSDIDIVILESKVKTSQVGLYALAKALTQKNIAKKIQVIAKARVPIIKFVEKWSSVAFDVSFDIDGGPKAADFIKDMVKKMPALRPLCMILKVFLHQRELNEVYSGGIGSYSLLAMLITHLQMNWGAHMKESRHKSKEHNLGILLIKFFDFYGRKLNNSDVGISCNSGKMFFLKEEKGFTNFDRPHLLAIQDPQDEANDIGKNSFNYYKVKSAFCTAFSTLTDIKSITSMEPHRSILGTIIRPDALLLNRRGGCDGELTFEDMLPGAGEPLTPEFGELNDIVHNWRVLDDEEPLPRGNSDHVDASTPPSHKRKSGRSKEKPRKKGKLDGSEGGRSQNGFRDEVASLQRATSSSGLGSSNRKEGRKEYNRFTNNFPQYNSLSRW